MSAAVLPLYPTVVEEPQPTYQKPDYKPTVRQLILSCKGIHPATKAVLAEICSMCAGAERKQYDGGNALLANKLGITEPMVSRHLKNLRECGLIEVSGGGRGWNGRARIITPNAELAAAYESGNANLITEVVKTHYRSGNKVITEVVMSHYRSGKHNIIESKGECEENEEQRSESSVSGSSAAADLQSKILRIQELEAKLKTWEEWGAGKVLQVDRLKARLASVEQELESMKAKSDTPPPVAPAPSKKRAQPAPKILMRDSAVADFAAFELAWKQRQPSEDEAFERAIQQVDLHHYHSSFLDWSEGNDNRKTNWFATIRNGMRKDFTENKLKTTQRTAASIAPTAPILTEEQRQRQLAAIRARNANQPIR